MKKIKIYILFFILFSFTGCKEEKPKKIVEKNGNYFEIKKEDFDGDFIFKDINLATEANQHHIKGIKLNFAADLTSKNKQRRRGFSDFGYQAYLIQISVFKEDGSIINSLQLNSKKESGPIAFEKYIEHIQNTAYDVFIPYSSLDVSEGAQNLLIKIEGFPAEYDSVKNPSGFGYNYRKKSENPDAVTEVLLHYTQPVIKKGSLRVCRFCINPKSKNPHSYDYRVLGSGYPDLYWELFTGKDHIYTSPIEKNRVTYEVCYNTPPFYFSDKDSIKIAFWDNDEMSKPDFIGEWIGSPYELQKLGDTNPEIAFDKINECKIVLDLIDGKK